MDTISQWEGSAELSLCPSVSLYLFTAPVILDLPSARKRQSPGRGLGERAVVGPYARRKNPARILLTDGGTIRKARQHRSKKFQSDGGGTGNSHLMEET